MTTNHYDTLEISPKATAAVISAAYRTLSQRYHPDKNNGDKHCEEMMAKINVAYGVLSDSIKRKMYDEEIGLNQTTSNNSNVGVAPTQQQSKQEESTPHRGKAFDLPEQPPIQPKSGSGFVGLFITLAIIGVLVYSASQQEEKQYKELENKYQMKENRKQYKWNNAEGLLTGINSAQNFQKALKEYKEIAEQNLFSDKRAEQRIAEIYFFGLGQTKDFNKAIEWYSKCYDSESQFMLGMIYFEGLGVKKDWITAYHYFNKSAGMQFDLPRTYYRGNNLILEQQEKMMFANKQEKENSFLEKVRTNKTSFSVAAKLKKDFLDTKLSVDEINKAQNLDIK